MFCLRNKNGAISKSAESFTNKIYFYCLCQNSNHYPDNLWVTISVNRLEIGLLSTGASLCLKTDALALLDSWVLESGQSASLHTLDHDLC